MKQLKLSIKDRIELPALLPPRGGLIQQEIVQMILDRLKFSAAEIEEYSIKDIVVGDDFRVTWDAKKAIDVDFSFEDSFVNVMKKGVETLDDAEAIPTTLVALCLKIKAL